jgi:hypothetical protein
MAITCDVILQWNATPGQLTALGAALWRWCRGAAKDSGIYPYLGNQALADLIAGRLPTTTQTPWEAERRGVPFRVLDEASPDRLAAIAGLRREMPADGIEDILVDGKSWNRPG